MNIPSHGEFKLLLLKLKTYHYPIRCSEQWQKKLKQNARKRAKIIAAEGEMQASAKLGEAADIISNHPVALTAPNSSNDGRNCS
jgi:hypothetical protein